MYRSLYENAGPVYLYLSVAKTSWLTGPPGQALAWGKVWQGKIQIADLTCFDESFHGVIYQFTRAGLNLVGDKTVNRIVHRHSRGLSDIRFIGSCKDLEYS